MPSKSELNTAPRGLRRVDAARYLGISPSHFDKQRDLGAIPSPKLLFGVMLWDRHDLDALFSAANDNQPDELNEWD
jgi:hypothetical protein